jgi:predicted  nucleic acid-binding Zn-ribbon protein
MNADLERLIVLQAQDLELKRLRQELAEAPRRVAAAESARAAAESALTAATAALKKEEALRHSQEVDIAERRSRIARLTKQMETATSAAQITALEHEIAFAQQAIAQLEDEELASLERTDKQESARATSTTALADTTAALAAERARGVALIQRNDAAIAALETERQALRTLIAQTDAGEALLSSYDRIARAKGTGLSEALDHKCSACQMMVRPQRWNGLTNRDAAGEFANTIFHCETCGRILFYDPRRDAPVAFPAADRLHSATTPTPQSS